MTRDKKRKQATRARMTKTGEHYQAAHRAIHPSPEQPTTTQPAEAPRPAVHPWTVMTEGVNLPKGWLFATSRPDSYELEMEQGAYLGKPAAHLRSTAEDVGATLSQVVHADPYRGKRVRLSGALRCHEACGAARLWMRVDDMNRRTIAFDNMQDRLVGGTRDWSTHAVVLDVDEQESLRICFGLLFGGAGHVWLADLRFEVVGLDVPTTGRPLTPVQERPVNLDFGE